MTRTTLPTTDLYFLNSCREWIGGLWRRGPVQRLGANTFRHGDRLLLIRRDDPALMEKAIHWRGELIYLIDDDITGASSSPGLPVSYRMRLADFEHQYGGRLLRRANTIVTSSEVLGETLANMRGVGADIILLDPFGPFLADQRHYPAALDSRWDVVHLGTASHAGAVTKISSAVTSMLDEFPFARFTFVGARGCNPKLESHPNVRRLNVMSWHRYRHWLPRQRFHLALYPLDRTPFDAARSTNKLFEHAIVGAVGIYHEGWGPAKMIAGGAILAPENPNDWSESLMQAMKQRLGLAALARKAATLLRNHDGGHEQRRVWARLLDLEIQAKRSS